MIESKRGCGFRKVGGLYLFGTGISVPCDMLPFPLRPCETCGYDIPFYRGFLWMNPRYLARAYHPDLEHDSNICTCSEFSRTHAFDPNPCPICVPKVNNERYGLMWIGTRDYTPDSFIKEVEEKGVMKRISKIPKGLKLGKTWVMLAYRKYLISEEFSPNGLRKSEPKEIPAIFYAFIPTRIDLLIWKSKASKRKLAKLKKQGITPVIVPDGDKDHA